MKKVGGGWVEKGGGTEAPFKTATTNNPESLAERAERRREWHIAAAAADGGSERSRPTSHLSETFRD